MTEAHARLMEKLCRELVQAERDAELHPRREADRLGAIPPGEAFRSIAAHAHRMRPGLEAIVKARGFRGRGVARGVAELFSGSRHALVDRLMRTERSYRMTLLGLRHGADLVRLLYKVATRARAADLASWCEVYLIEREPLIERALVALAWFASEPAVAIRSSARAELPAAGLDERLARTTT